MGSVLANMRGFSFGQKTAAANTIFTRVIPPLSRSNQYRTRITRLVYTSGATQHTVTCMRTIARTTITATVAAGGTVITLARDPGLYAANYVSDGITNGTTQVVPGLADNAIATNDWVVIQLSDGTWHLSLVTMAALVATLTTAIGAAALVGAPVHFLGITTDKHPETNEAHPAVLPTVSVVTTFGDGTGTPVFETQKPGDVLVLHSGNGTAQGYIESVGGVYYRPAA